MYVGLVRLGQARLYQARRGQARQGQTCWIWLASSDLVDQARCFPRNCDAHPLIMGLSCCGGSCGAGLSKKALPLDGWTTISVFVQDAATGRIVWTLKVWKPSKQILVALSESEKAGMAVAHKWETFDIAKFKYIEGCIKLNMKIPKRGTAALKCFLDGKPKDRNSIVATDPDIKDGSVIVVVVIHDS